MKTLNHSSILLLLGMTWLCCLVAGCGKTAIYSPPQLGNPLNPPAVKIIVPAEGQTFHAHQDIRLLVLATPNGTDLGPDDSISKVYANANYWDLEPSRDNQYSIDFLADTNNVGTQTASLTTARVRSHPGQITPTFIGLVGYPAAELIWHDAPAGAYSLTTKVTNAKGLATTSAPVKITVLP